ncbi:hypothetical protein B0O99DRAFT_626041 [Bisporella sp. PMI_857]|nr:hypothetical protein B0O99DRAFT_626041 [Bisporella sp. PMI_857]
MLCPGLYFDSSIISKSASSIDPVSSAAAKNGTLKVFHPKTSGSSSSTISSVRLSSSSSLNHQCATKMLFSLKPRSSKTANVLRDMTHSGLSHEEDSLSYRSQNKAPSSAIEAPRKPVSKSSTGRFVGRSSSPCSRSLTRLHKFSTRKPLMNWGGRILSMSYLIC